MTTRRWSRPLALLAVPLLVAGAASCGSDTDEGSSPSGSADDTEVVVDDGDATADDGVGAEESTGGGTAPSSGCDPANDANFAPGAPSALPEDLPEIDAELVREEHHVSCSDDGYTWYTLFRDYTLDGNADVASVADPIVAEYEAIGFVVDNVIEVGNRTIYELRRGGDADVVSIDGQRLNLQVDADGDGNATFLAYVFSYFA